MFLCFRSQVCLDKIDVKITSIFWHKDAHRFWSVAVWKKVFINTYLYIAFWRSVLQDLNGLLSAEKGHFFPPLQSGWLSCHCIFWHKLFEILGYLNCFFLPQIWNMHGIHILVLMDGAVYLQWYPGCCYTNRRHIVYTDTHIYIAAAIYRSGRRHKPGFVHSMGIRMHARKWFGHRGKAKNRGLPFCKAGYHISLLWNVQRPKIKRDLKKITWIHRRKEKNVRSC